MLWRFLGVVIGLIPFAVLLAISRIFVPWRLAVRMALLMMVVGLIIFSGGTALILQMNKKALQDSPGLLAIEALVAVVAMVLTGLLFIRWVHKRRRQSVDVFD